VRKQASSKKHQRLQVRDGIDDLRGEAERPPYLKHAALDDVR